MRNRLLAAASLLALLAWDPVARAASFDYTGSLDTFTVPVTGSYRILAFGAQGGSGFRDVGGNGAEIGGEFSLTAGDVLQIAVGGFGGDSATAGGGGGGGSFVIGPGNTKLVIAGGGGGGSGGSTNGGGGLTGGAGGTGGGFSPGSGGTGGGGGGATIAGGGGGGFAGNGGNGGGANGGGSFPGLAGGGGLGDGGSGGFGGGGGADSSDLGGGGGGGGYSGGGGGGVGGFGGGGGSFDAGLNQILMGGVRTGNGEVVITFVFAGTPGAANCLGKSVSSLASQNRGLSHAAAALGYASVQALQDAISAYCADVPKKPVL